MYHYRIDLSGTRAARRAAAAALGQPRGETALVLAREEGVEFLEPLSRAHPKVTFGVECFEAFEDELLHAVVKNGETTVMSQSSLPPAGGPLCHDPGGEPIDDDLLRAAAEEVLEHRLRYKVGSLGTGLLTALSMGRALGRLCQRVEDTLFDDPSADAIDAVLEMAVAALWTSAVGTHGTAKELEFDHALRLTQAMIHAGKSEYSGPEDWMEWVTCVIDNASHVICAAANDRIEPATEEHALESEHLGSPTDHLEAQAQALLTTCLETLAFFSDAAAARQVRSA